MSTMFKAPPVHEVDERQMRQAYQRRIEFLCREAALDGFTMNADSERDFWAFIRSIPSSQKASLVLWDNGHLRAVWKGAEESHLGLRFLGDQRVEYVIFKRFPAAEKVSRVAGFDTFDGIKNLLATHCVKATHPARTAP